MKNVSLALLVCLTAAACSTPQQSTGTATGAVGGALVGGPVGAVVGGVAGAAVTAPGAPLGAGYCYARDRNGNIRTYANGRARTYRC